MSNPVSVASNTSAGAAGGSVIDVASLVSQLVTATATPQQNLITAQTQQVTTQISSLGTLKGALATFQESLAALDSPDAFNAEDAASSNESVFTAEANSGAPVGTYNVTVTQLASAQQLLSNAIGGTGGNGATEVGTGTLQISLGNSSFNVNITDDNKTLAGIVSAINTADNNPGVTATIVQGKDGPHLLLSSSLTGADNTISVSETDSGGALSALTYSGTDTSNYKVQSQALDAEYSIAGVDATSSSNTISDAVKGVTLTLTGKSPADTPATLTVSTNTNTIESNIAGFVSAYNALAGTFQQLGGYDSTTGTAGPMMGNALLSSIQNGMRSALYGIVNSGSSTYNSLASIGITTNQDGTISLNSSKLQTALSTNFSAVSQLFSGKDGVATKLNTQLTTELAAKTGIIAQNSQQLTNQSNALDKKTQDLNTQMQALSASLTQQYSALNTLLSQLQTTSSYLTQAFASLPQVQSKSG